MKGLLARLLGGQGDPEAAAYLQEPALRPEVARARGLFPARQRPGRVVNVPPPLPSHRRTEPLLQPQDIAGALRDVGGYTRAAMSGRPYAPPSAPYPPPRMDRPAPAPVGRRTPLPLALDFASTVNSEMGLRPPPVGGPAPEIGHRGFAPADAPYPVPRPGDTGFGDDSDDLDAAWAAARARAQKPSGARQLIPHKDVARQQQDQLRADRDGVRDDPFRFERNPFTGEVVLETAEERRMREEEERRIQAQREREQGFNVTRRGVEYRRSF